MKLSLTALKVAVDPNLVPALAALANNNARGIVGALTLDTLTDNSTGAAGSALVALPTQATKVAQSGSNLASRTAFNTAVGKANNAVAVLSKFLNENGLTALGLTNLSGYDGTVAADGTVPAQDKTVAGVTGAGVQATGTLTSTGNFTDGDTVTIGSKVYTMQDTLTNVDGNVKIGASATASLLNLARAINDSGGTPGTDYAAAMTAHPSVTATSDATTVVVTAILSGTAGNSIATTEVSTAVSWGGATLSGGSDGLGMLRSEFNAAVVRLRNNLATCVRGYNVLATALGVATIADNTLGSASTTFAIGANVAAGTTVAGEDVAGNDLATKAAADAFLTAFANNVAFIMAKLANPLLLTGTLTGRVPVALVP